MADSGALAGFQGQCAANLARGWDFRLWGESSRHHERLAIANRRLVSANQRGVSFRWKDYRVNGAARYKTMTLPTHEFIRRFLMHVLPKGFHRIRHYGFLANGNRAANVAQARHLLALPGHDQASDHESPEKPDEPNLPAQPCPSCGGPMVIIETFEPGQTPTHHRQRAPPHSPSDIP